MSTNVTPHEVEKFNQLSEFWWDPEGPLKTLHQVQPIRMRFIREQCTLSQKKMIDVGCGGGILTEGLAQWSNQVTGIDKAENALEIARLHGQMLQNAPHYELTTAEDYAESHSAQFDIVTCLELIEHVPSPESLIASLSQLVKPNGDVFISTLNRTLKCYVMAILAAEYALNLIPKGTHDYKAFIKPSELATLARSFGLTLVHIRGISYRPLSQSFGLSADVSVNYIAHFKKD